MPAALRRFTTLHTLALSGNASNIDWACRGAAEAAGKLTLLRARFTKGQPHAMDWDDEMEALCVPAQLTQALVGAASRLETVDIEARWSANLAQLCRSLPALRSLRPVCKRLGCHWVGSAWASGVGVGTTFCVRVDWAVLSAPYALTGQHWYPTGY